jgi:hypothetical protein
LSAGNNIEARIAMIAITTRSSTSVNLLVINKLRLLRLFLFFIFQSPFLKVGFDSKLSSPLGGN